MCGNLGLLLTTNSSSAGPVSVRVVPSNTPDDAPARPPLKPPLSIVREQIAATEVRGGQAGGISTVTFGSTVASARVRRCRMVGHKRRPLADDLVSLYRGPLGLFDVASGNSISLIGHTRFATSSVNTVPELVRLPRRVPDRISSVPAPRAPRLQKCKCYRARAPQHPHDFFESGVFNDSARPAEELFWRWNATAGAFQEHTVSSIKVHVCHNGDFDLVNKSIRIFSTHLASLACAPLASSAPLV